jgi:hypothetical protein
MPKVVGSLVGYITRATLGLCAVGRATILRETLPWHVQYSTFSGLLPNITSVRTLTDTRFRIMEPFGIACLFASTAERRATLTFGRGAGGTLTSVERGGTISSADCLGMEATLSGRGSVSVLNAATGITVTLI